MAPNSLQVLVLALSLLSPAAAIPVDVSFPQDAWMKATCSSTVKDLGASPKSRWDAAQAEGAIAAANRNWNQHAGSHGTDVKLNYVNSIMNLWGQNEQNCGLVQDSCDFSSLQCGDSTMTNPPVPFPGAWLVMKSLGNIHRFYLNFYTAMGDAGAAVTGKMGGFVGTFAPEATEDLFTKIVKGFAETTISMLVGQALGPVFGRLSEQIADGILEPVFGTIQDGIGKAIDEGIASGELKDPSQADKQNALVEALTALLESQRSVIKSYVDNLLSGKVNKLSEFHDQISDGKWINDALGGKDLFDLKDAAQKTFAAVLLPQAWKLNKDTVPVILMEDKDCNLGEPIQEMNFDTTHATGSCVIAGKTMWLVGLNTEQCRTGPNPFGPGGNKPDPCPINVFRRLPGFDKLGDFGFSKDDIIAGAYAGYQLNGNKNGYQVDPNSRVKDGSGAEGSFPFSNGILTPGVFNIPICDIHQAVEAYKNGKGGATPLCDYGTQ